MLGLSGQSKGLRIGFLVALSKIQKKILTRFLPNGILQIAQQPDVSNKIAHIWITSNREVFGFEEYTLSASSLILELPVRQLLSIMRATEDLETLRFEYVERMGDSQSKLVISSGSELITFTSTVHELPVKRFSPIQAETLFREPLISKPAITFVVPSIVTLHDKLTRLVKQASAVTVSANHEGRFVCTVDGSILHTELIHPNVQIVNPAEMVQDRLELLDITLSLESLVKVLGCTATMQGQVLSAIAPGESIIFTSKIPNPCGPDRPSGSISIIIGAFEVS